MTPGCNNGAIVSLPSNTSGHIDNGGIELFVDVRASASPSGDVVLLLSEAEAPSTRWPETFVEGLAALGCAVIRFDTRDIGRSSWLDDPYLIDDLVTDARFVLDHFEVASAHICGRSMGGIVAQHLAIDSPERVASLSFLSTTPGRRDDLGLPEPWLVDLMTERLYGDRPESLVERVGWVIDQLEWFSGPLFDFDRTAAAQAGFTEVSEMWRGPNGHGHAVVEVEDRFDELPLITAHSMVVHGTADPVYPVAHGQALAEQLEHASLHLIEGLGHELPERFVPQVIDLFAHLRHRARAEA
jgi:pimeloyl-ACP methyl ester carboxylesterase